MDITIVDYFGYRLTPQERMQCIKNACFSGVLLLWTGDFDKDYKMFPEYARKVGLYVENTHAPYIGCNDLWIDNLDGQKFTDRIIECIKDCSTYEIPTIVMHLESKKGNIGVELPESYDIGLDRFKRIIDIAEKLNINIAIENMSRPEFLSCIFENIDSRRLGFCFDSGHWNVFTPDLDLLTLYGDKLISLHLHDNDGKDDWHSLPFSGNIDWNEIKNKLKENTYKGTIALEVLNKNFEHINEPEKFLELAFERAKRLII